MTDENYLSVECSENAEPMLSVLVVDCDSTCLTIVSEMLHTLGYAVTTAKQADDALRILQERKEELDLILTEVQLPDMDECELLEKMGEVSCLPIVILSSANDENVMLGGLLKGAAFYFVKPITTNNVKNLWQFSCKKNNNNSMTTAIEGMSSFQGEPTEDYSSSKALECQSFSNTGEQSAQKGKRKNIEDMDKNDEEHGISNDLTVSKKSKVVWRNELHNQFLRAVRSLGIDGAHPKSLQYMNVPGLKEKHVSSHLQKYCLSLKREEDAIQETMIRDYHPSSSLCFLPPRLLMAACQEELPSHFQLYSTCISCSHVGFRNISDGGFATFGQMGNYYIEEVLSQRLTLSNLGNAGSEWAVHGPTFCGSYQQQQLFLLPELSSLTLPPRHEQELDVV